MELTPCIIGYTRAAKNKSTKAKPVRIKDKGILIRVTAVQKKVLAEAAAKECLGLSSWMLSVAMREIEHKELRQRWRAQRGTRAPRLSRATRS